jgi:RNA polymerase sigma factor (sigma-70 family)
LNRDEYNIAVKMYSGRLFRFISKNLRQNEDARDIVQDSFEKLWEYRSKVEFEKSRSWLFTTAYNRMLNLVKKQKRIDLVDEWTNESGVTDRQFETKDLVDKCLARLPELQRSILLLRDLEGYDYREIGEILNLSESQVKVYLFRARLKIKEHIKDLTVIS